MFFATRQPASHDRKHTGHRARIVRLSAAVEPLERRRLLTAVVVNTTSDVTHAAGSTVVSLRDAIAIASTRPHRRPSPLTPRSLPPPRPSFSPKAPWSCWARSRSRSRRPPSA